MISKKELRYLAKLDKKIGYLEELIQNGIALCPKEREVFVICMESELQSMKRELAEKVSD